MFRHGVATWLPAQTPGNTVAGLPSMPALKGSVQLHQRTIALGQDSGSQVTGHAFAGDSGGAYSWPASAPFHFLRLVMKWNAAEQRGASI